ncbi:MAG: alpha-galactosidase [Phycisphaerae bacterium]
MLNQEIPSKPHHTEISFYQSGGRPTARYVSGSTVYEESLENGRWVDLYWSAGGQVQRENLTAKLPGLNPSRYPLEGFQLEMDGQLLHNRWEHVGSSRRPGLRAGTEEAVVELRHTVRPVNLKIVTRVDGSPVLVRYLEITNTGIAPAALSRVASWSGRLWSNADRPIDSQKMSINPSFPKGKPQFRVGFLAGDRWGEEGDFTWHDIIDDAFSLRRFATGRAFGSPYAVVENLVTGQRFFLALAWSGNYGIDFDVCDGKHLYASLSPMAPAPLRVLAPGEMVTSPEVHIAPTHGSLDAAVALWHRHVRTSVLPTRPAGKEMYTIAGRVVEEPGEWILKEVDIAAEMGAEAFMVDAAWYGAAFDHWGEQRGDWTEGSWLPGGLKGIRDHCKKHGLLFGLWHEAEAIGRKSRLKADHPDWVLNTDGGQQCAETLDLANPEVSRFVEDTVLRLVKEHQLDFYKLDFNTNVQKGGQTLRDGFLESEFWRHHEVIHRTYDRVRREFPDVCLENCASGGARNDLGMLSRFHYTCESDWSMHPIAIRAINALSLFIPPEALCYYHNHLNFTMDKQAHFTADMDTHLRVTLFAVPVFVGFGAQDADRSTEFFQKTKRYLQLHKGFCRPVIAGHPVVYHHTPDIGVLRPADWCVLEYAAPDRSRGYAGVFRLGVGAGEYRLRLRGVDLGSDYQVTLDNRAQTFTMSGRDLALSGLPIALDSAMTSELVMYEKGAVAPA